MKIIKVIIFCLIIFMTFSCTFWDNTINVNLSNNTENTINQIIIQQINTNTPIIELNNISIDPNTQNVLIGNIEKGEYFLQILFDNNYVYETDLDLRYCQKNQTYEFSIDTCDVYVVNNTLFDITDIYIYEQGSNNVIIASENTEIHPSDSYYLGNLIRDIYLIKIIFSDNTQLEQEINALNFSNLTITITGGKTI